MKLTEDIQKINEAYDQACEIISNGRFEIATELINKLYNKSIKINYEHGVLLYYGHHIEILFQTNQNHAVVPFLLFIIKKCKHSNCNRLGNYYTKLGIVLSRLFDNTNSLIYLNKGLVFNLKHSEQNHNNVTISYLGLINNYFRQNSFEKAMSYIDLVFNDVIIKIEDYKFSILFFRLTLFQVLIYIKQNNLIKANESFSNIRKESTSFNKSNNTSFKEIELELYILNNNYEKEEVVKKSLSLLKASIELENSNLRKRILTLLVSFHTKHNELELAFNYSDQLFIFLKKEDSRNVPFLYNKFIEKHKEVFLEANEEYEIYLKNDLEIASNLQSNFFKNTNNEKFDISISFKPSKIVSGDYIGSFNLNNDDSRCLFILADIAGKGIAASYMSFMLNGIIKSILLNADYFSLKNIIKDINSILSDSFKGQSFVSLWAGFVDLNTNTLESINAGHLPAYLINKENQITELVKGTTVLGIFEELQFIESEIIPFTDNMSIISYSDGVTESLDSVGNDFEEIFINQIKNYATNRSFNFINQLESVLNLFQDDSLEQDDVSCLLINYKIDQN